MMANLKLMMLDLVASFCKTSVKCVESLPPVGRPLRTCCTLRQRSKLTADYPYSFDKQQRKFGLKAH
jgi:hypothetical protein